MEKGESPNALPNSNNNAAQEAKKKEEKSKSIWEYNV